VLDVEYHDGIGTALLEEYKVNLFGSPDIVLHSADISRKRKGFECLHDPEVENRFRCATVTLVRELEFVALGVALHKERHVQRYTSNSLNPYHYTLECMLERFYYILRDARQTGMVIAESRGAQDADLEHAYDTFMSHRTAYVSGSALSERILGLDFRIKAENLLGLQIADMIAKPLSHIAMETPCRPDCDVVREKLRKRPGTTNYLGYGLKILP
jgi:hypothetical protein